MDLGKDNGIGRFALTPGPLIHIFSVTVHPNRKEPSPFAIYGKINAEFCDSVYGGMVGVDIYNRPRHDPELLGTLGALTLNAPNSSASPDEAFVPMFRARLHVDLFDGTGNVFVQDSFSLDDNKMVGWSEKVESMSIGSKLTIRYILIPFGVHCRVDVLFRSQSNYAKQDTLNVNGNITARFLHTYGNYNSEESLLFLKHPTEFERVELDGEMMQLSRCWVTLPAYASLVIALDLSEFQTRRKLVHETVEFPAQPGMLFGRTFMADNIVVQARVAWFPPPPLGPLPKKSLPSPHEIPTRGESGDAMDTDTEDEFASDEESYSSLGTTWSLRPHKNVPASSPAVEIFSVVVIGRDKSDEIHIHGSIGLISDGHKVCNIFKRDLNDAMRLTQVMRSSPILDGSRKYDDCSTLEIDFDLKDVDNHVVIKGFKEWEELKLEKRRDQQLCCFVRGVNGFAAVHYSIFPLAVSAAVKISVNLKESLGLYVGCDIYGSIISQYRDFDYSSRYNKDYYRVVLFERVKDKAIQLGFDGSMPLSRSMLVVPSYSSLIISLDLSIGASGLNVSHVKEIEIGEGCKTIETDELLVRIDVDWCKIK